MICVWRGLYSVCMLGGGAISRENEACKWIITMYHSEKFIWDASEHSHCQIIARLFSDDVNLMYFFRIMDCYKNTWFWSGCQKDRRWHPFLMESVEKIHVGTSFKILLLKKRLWVLIWVKNWPCLYVCLQTFLKLLAGLTLFVGWY